jgi:hypothetical protein
MKLQKTCSTSCSFPPRPTAAGDFQLSCASNSPSNCIVQCAIISHTERANKARPCLEIEYILCANGRWQRRWPTFFPLSIGRTGRGNEMGFVPLLRTCILKFPIRKVITNEKTASRRLSANGENCATENQLQQHTTCGDGKKP